MDQVIETLQNADNILEVTDLCKFFKAGRKQTLKAVDNVSVSIRRGETLGLVGESGCGKTTCGRTMIKLYEPTSGKVVFDGKDISTLKGKDLLEFKKNVQVIFQDPYASLDPRMTIGEIISEGMDVHFHLSEQEKNDRVADLLNKVGLSAEYANRFAHELSGGQRQRVGIARALAVEPKFIVCDEPISALDVSIQAQVVNLLIKLQKEFGLTYLFISHDLSMVKHISDRVGVMYLGSMVELASNYDLYDKPLHPYTQALISAIPMADPDGEATRERIKLEGEVPSPINPPPGCKFRPRCRYAMPICEKEAPQLLEVEPKTEVLTFKRGEKNPLPADAVIVDEMSMVDTLLMEHLLRGMRLGARLIMVGDSDQLPSVSAGNVLRDLIQSGLVPCIHLERVFRQAAESLIVTNAHAIVRGEMPDLGCRTGDFFFLEQPDAFAQQRLVVDLVSRRLPKSYGYDPLRDIQVITPAKQGPLGTRELNRLLQGKLNPPERGKGEATLMGRTLREGDKVMQIRNNYDIIWQQPDGTAGTGIFNGDMGIIEMLDPGSKTIQVRFEEKLATYSFENQDQLEHAYAVTVHKSQGSEFEAVVMPLERRHPKLHYRNLLYTAVTRARKLLIMTGQKETVYAMVQNNRRTLRYTNQKEMLQEMCDE